MMLVKMFTLVSLPTLMKIYYLTKELDILWNFTIRWYLSISILKGIPGVCSFLLCYVDEQIQHFKIFLLRYNATLQPEIGKYGSVCKNLSCTLEHFAISGRLCRWAMRCVKRMEEEK